MGGSQSSTSNSHTTNTTNHSIPAGHMSEDCRLPDRMKDAMAGGVGTAVGSEAGPWAGFAAHTATREGLEVLESAGTKYAQDYNQALDHSQGNELYAQQMADLQNGWFTDSNPYAGP